MHVPGPPRPTPAREHARHGDPFDSIVGRSPRLRQVVRRARLLANIESPLLLQGETGVGKEVFARAIHQGGRHRAGPFVAVNCGGLPRELLASELFGYVEGAFTGARRAGMVGKLEAAHGGTLFLDELGEMPLELQPYLLRALEGGEVYPLGSTRARSVRFRLVASSNRDLRSEVSASRFRMDLFYRISVTSLRLPPLRERREDLPALVAYFARNVAQLHGVEARPFAPEVLLAFERYPWPGNVRELRNTVESMLLLSEGTVVDTATLPAEIAAEPLEARGDHDGPAPALAQIERDVIGRSIRAHRGNLARVAKELRISRSTLYLKLRKHGLEPTVMAVRARQPYERDARAGGSGVSATITDAGRKSRSLTR